jgi:monofunctional biosynthetic peptidoglycan transglycosylase
MTSVRRRRNETVRVLRWAGLAVLTVLLLPYALVPVYRFVDPVSTLMLWRWATGARVERTFVPLERISPALPLAVIVSEDGRFCAHRGIDWRELRAAIVDADDLREARGGSTITQQVAKTCSCGRGEASSARRWKRHSRFGSILCCPSAASWRSI